MGSGLEEEVFDDDFKVEKLRSECGLKQFLEIEKLKIELKKYYSQLGLYVARQYILKGRSDFSLDEKFVILNKNIKENSLRLKKIANK